MKLRHGSLKILLLPALLTLLAGGLTWRDPGRGMDAWRFLVRDLGTFLALVPPVFVFLGLFDAWVPRERFVALMGADRGLRGMGIAVLLGAFAAGPLYIAFPIALVLRRKGASPFHVLLFVGSWSTLKLPMLLFEIQSMGARFALTRYALSLAGIFLIAGTLCRIPFPALPEDPVS